MKRKPLSCLAVARRQAYGSLETAAQQTGVPRSTMQRAEAGQSVSRRIRQQIQATFGAPLEDLQKVFLASIIGSVAGSDQ
ncbi:MAG: hypothetical protein WB438_03675 [Candidatus Cybelea sp.]